MAPHTALTQEPCEDEEECIMQEGSPQETKHRWKKYCAVLAVIALASSPFVATRFWSSSQTHEPVVVPTAPDFTNLPDQGAQAEDGLEKKVDKILGELTKSKSTGEKTQDYIEGQMDNIKAAATASIDCVKAISDVSVKCPAADLAKAALGLVSAVMVLVGGALVPVGPILCALGGFLLFIFAEPEEGGPAPLTFDQVKQAVVEALGEFHAESVTEWKLPAKVSHLTNILQNIVLLKGDSKEDTERQLTTITSEARALQADVMESHNYLFGSSPQALRTKVAGMFPFNPECNARCANNGALEWPSECHNGGEPYTFSNWRNFKRGMLAWDKAGDLYMMALPLLTSVYEYNGMDTDSSYFKAFRTAIKDARPASVLLEEQLNHIRRISDVIPPIHSPSISGNDDMFITAEDQFCYDDVFAADRDSWTQNYEKSKLNCNYAEVKNWGWCNNKGNLECPKKDGWKYIGAQVYEPSDSWREDLKCVPKMKEYFEIHPEAVSISNFDSTSWCNPQEERQESCPQRCAHNIHGMTCTYCVSKHGWCQEPGYDCSGSGGTDCSGCAEGGSGTSDGGSCADFACMDMKACFMSFSAVCARHKVCAPRELADIISDVTNFMGYTPDDVGVDLYAEAKTLGVQS